MYYDDFDHHPTQPKGAELPVRSGWPRLLGAVLFGLLTVLHACA